MAFAKEHREEITLAYYCFNVVLAIVFFAYGTIYLKRRDRRDQQIKEWRDFAETIRKENNELKGKNIPWKISSVKDAFGKIQIYKRINGTDVLRFMMRDPKYKRCKTKHLDVLRKDLDSIYPLLNRCASLILLGAVPKNIRAELEKLVTDLAKLTLPFYKAEERKTILKCLRHFGGEEPEEDERRRSNIDRSLETDIPYVRRLSLHAAKNDEEYKFTFQFPREVVQGYQFYLRTSLENLHHSLEQERYMSGFANELRKRAFNFIDKIDAGDPDELVVEKVLHEIRSYIHFSEQGPLNNERDGNVKTLMDIHKSVTSGTSHEQIVREVCGRFMQDLSTLMKDMKECHKTESFSSQFVPLYEMFLAIREDKRETSV